MSMEAVGGTQWGTDHRDQYIISYKLNSTWIDPQGARDHLRSVDGRAVNPTDHYGGSRVRGVWSGRARPGLRDPNLAHLTSKVEGSLEG